MIVGKKLSEEDDNRIKTASTSSSRFNNNTNNNNLIANDSIIIGGKVELDSLRSPHIEQLKIFKSKEKLKHRNIGNTINQQDNQQDEENNNNNNNNDNNNNQKDTKYHIQRSARYEHIDNNNDHIIEKIADDEYIEKTSINVKKGVQSRRVLIELSPEEKKNLENERFEKAQVWLNKEKMKRNVDKNDILKRKEVLKKLEQDIKQKLEMEAEARSHFNQELLKNEFTAIVSDKNTVTSGSENKSINQNEIDNMNNNIEKKNYIRDISEMNKRALKLVLNTDLNSDINNNHNPLASPGVPIKPRRGNSKRDTITNTNILKSQFNEKVDIKDSKKILIKRSKKFDGSDDENDTVNKENIIDAKYNEEKQRRLEEGRAFAEKQRKARLKQLQDKKKEELEEIKIRQEKLMLLNAKSRKLAVTKTLVIPNNNIGKVTFNLPEEVVSISSKIESQQQTKDSSEPPSRSPSISPRSPPRSPQSPLRSSSPQSLTSTPQSPQQTDGSNIRRSLQLQQIHDSINASLQGTQAVSKLDKTLYFDYTNQNVQYRTIFKPLHMKAVSARHLIKLDKSQGYTKGAGIVRSSNSNLKFLPKQLPISQRINKSSNRPHNRRHQSNIIRRTSFQSNSYTVKPRRKIEKPKELKVELTELLDKDDIAASIKKNKNYIEIKNYPKPKKIPSLGFTIPDYTSSPQEPLDVVEKAQKNVEAVKHVISKVDRISSTLRKLTLDLENTNLFDRDSIGGGADLMVAARNSLSTRLGLAFTHNDRYNDDNKKGSHLPQFSPSKSQDALRSDESDDSDKENDINYNDSVQRQDYDEGDSVLIVENESNSDEVQFIEDHREYSPHNDRVRRYAEDILEADQTWQPKTDIITDYEHDNAIYKSGHTPNPQFATANDILFAREYPSHSEVEDNFSHDLSYFSKQLLQNEDRRLAQLEEAAMREANTMAKELDSQRERAKISNTYSESSTVEAVEYWDKMLSSPLRASMEPMIEKSKLSMLLKQSEILTKDDAYSKPILKDMDDIVSIDSSKLAPSLRRASMLKNLTKSIDSAQSGIARQALKDYREEMEQKLRLHEKSLKYKLHVLKANRLQNLAAIQQERRKLRISKHGVAIPRVSDYLLGTFDDSNTSRDSIENRVTIEELDKREADIEKEYRKNRKELERENWAFRAYTYKELKKFKSLNEHIEDYELRLKGGSRGFLSQEKEGPSHNHSTIEDAELSAEDRRKRIEDLNTSLQSLATTRQKLAVVKARQLENEVKEKLIEEEHRLLGLLHEETKRIEEEVAELAVASPSRGSRHTTPQSSPTKILISSPDSSSTPLQHSNSSQVHSSRISKVETNKDTLSSQDPMSKVEVLSNSSTELDSPPSATKASEEMSTNLRGMDLTPSSRLINKLPDDENLGLEEGLDLMGVQHMVPRFPNLPQNSGSMYSSSVRNEIPMIFDSMKQVWVGVDVDLDGFDSIASASIDSYERRKKASYDSYDSYAQDYYEIERRKRGSSDSHDIKTLTNSSLIREGVGAQDSFMEDMMKKKGSYDSFNDKNSQDSGDDNSLRKTGSIDSNDFNAVNHNESLKKISFYDDNDYNKGSIDSNDFNAVNHNESLKKISFYDDNDYNKGNDSNNEVNDDKIEVLHDTDNCERIAKEIAEDTVEHYPEASSEKIDQAADLETENESRSSNIQETIKGLSIDTDIKDNSGHSEEVPSVDSDRDTVAWYRNHKKSSNYSPRDKSQPLSPSSNYSNHSPGRDYESSMLTESVDVSLDICNLSNDDLSSPNAKLDEDKLMMSDSSSSANDNLDNHHVILDNAASFTIDKNIIDDSIESSDHISENGNLKKSVEFSNNDISYDDNEIENESDNYEEIEGIEEIEEIADDNSIVDDVTDAILSKLLVNIHHQGNEEPNESLILEGNEGHVNDIVILANDDLNVNSCISDQSIIDNDNEDEDEDELYKNEFEDNYDIDTNNNSNISNETIKIIETPKPQFVNWKVGIKHSLDEMMGNLNIENIISYLNDESITNPAMELDINSSFLDKMTEEVLESWMTHSDVLLDRIDELIRELKKRRHIDSSTHFQANNPRSFPATIVAKEMPLRVDIIKHFIKERLSNEQDISIDIMNQKKYILELVDVDIVEEINDEIDKRLKLTVSDIVDVILARLIVSTTNSIYLEC